MEIICFTSAADFRQWLKTNGGKATEVVVGFYKKDSGKNGITYAEALDEVLCFGWIDGVRKRIDGLSYMIRFTPRKPKSIWSKVNIKRVEALKELGRMQATGLQAFARRDPARSGIYSFENAERKLEAAAEKRFKANRKAWEFFRAQAPWYQRTASWWVMSAKREETKSRRLEQLIQDSEKGQRLAHLARKV
ncbi:YdeI/OmpD-associated family protein [Pedosphaera parvula]|uniref:Bacteriocin-protection protein, YdeI/OmpD-associated family n=1 Tax=Pedosphaera parvula (strain Ellin514) TaxID=320771 RepID=B9XCR5_PEDPL|nr:YdeI/OmpD-associated family protein [Pedosphaera parvula]EEF62261.1 conserved hypothetical protein [Pedosphaera parvula Ellin514]